MSEQYHESANNNIQHDLSFNHSFNPQNKPPNQPIAKIAQEPFENSQGKQKNSLLKQTLQFNLMASKQEEQGKQSNSRKILQIFSEFDKNNTGEVEIDFLQVMLNKHFEQQIPPDVMQHVMVGEDPVDLLRFQQIVAEVQNQLNQEKLKDTYEQPHVSQEERKQQKYQKFIMLLECYRKVCHQKGNYSAAGLATQRIKEIKDKLLKIQQKTLKKKQKQINKKIKIQAQEEFQKLDEGWEQEEIANLKERWQEILEIRKKQKEDYKKYKEAMLEENSTFRIKFSKRVLELKNKCSVLANAQEYQLADHLKLELDILMHQEEMEQRKEHKRKIKKQLKQFKNQQKLALSDFIAQIRNHRDVQYRQHLNQKQQLQLKNQNLLKEMQFNQLKNLRNIKQVKALPVIHREVQITEQSQDAQMNKLLNSKFNRENQPKLKQSAVKWKNELNPPTDENAYYQMMKTNSNRANSTMRQSKKDRNNMSMQLEQNTHEL